MLVCHFGHWSGEVYTKWCNITVILPSLLFLSSFPPSSFLFSLSNKCNLIRLDCPVATSPSEHVALHAPTPLPLPDTDFFGVEVGLIDVQQFYIRVQLSFSSWLLQSGQTAGSIRTTPPHTLPSSPLPVHTDHCLWNWKHFYKSHPCLKLQAPNNRHKYPCVIKKIRSCDIFIPDVFYSGSLSNPTSFYFVHFDLQ